MVRTALAAVGAVPGSNLELRGVSHSFDFEPAPLPVLDHIHLRVERGEFVALLGPSVTSILCALVKIVRDRAGSVPTFDRLRWACK